MLDIPDKTPDIPGEKRQDKIIKRTINRIS